ncbi:hypothetical protein VO64_3615 [Pseudomonas synxantha]|uniref:Uncharacterized protein n=1 Tax=Pseudomonas synxantha TaxID=47883 RepID=A0AAU8TUM5_9PSED|nr:hypothetical protein VO64_3615 [Pseudomonas synxantha]
MDRQQNEQRPDQHDLEPHLSQRHITKISDERQRHSQRQRKIRSKYAAHKRQKVLPEKVA